MPCRSHTRSQSLLVQMIATRIGRGAFGLQVRIVSSPTCLLLNLALRCVNLASDLVFRARLHAVLQ
jgi:hypothetical protein